MGSEFSSHVKDIFIKLYESGLIYQGNYMVNWDPELQSAIADDEVETKPCKSKLYWIKYFNADKTKSVTVATSRPETLFGDVAIGFNDQDARYQADQEEYLIPIIGKPIGLIPDPAVDKDFGSGLVKITPAHDKFDFEFANRHGLQPVTIIDKTGKIVNTGTNYDTMPVKVARRIIVKELTTLGHIEKIVEYDSVQKTCYRTGAQIEPLCTTQWFVDMKALGAQTDQFVKSGQVQLFPENQINTYNTWMEGLRPWCISRQLIWGHRIPVFYCGNCSIQVASKETQIQCTRCKANMTQDPDVLDTWFSSWLWAYGVFKPEELDYYFPTDCLITGSDILFFWVIRMMMASKFMKGVKPFSKVYLHGIVRDESNKKMSKSLGNVIDPLVLIDKFGCDPVRFSLLMTTPYSSDVPISEKTFDIGKTFCTKFWNVVRYAQSIVIANPDGWTGSFSDYVMEGETDANIIARFEQVKSNIATKLDEFEFAKATRELYSWVWDDLANGYLEYCKDKISTKKHLLLHLIWETIQQAHPFIPHITSEMSEVLNNTLLNTVNKINQTN